MPDYRENFDSPWLKANVNVKTDDHIRFLDNGAVSKNNDGREVVEFNVGIVRDGEIVKEKKFTLNKGNYTATSTVYGWNTDKWVGKEMRVEIIKTRTPQGAAVDGVLLTAPNTDSEGDTIFD
jgi:hypothetical protein